MMSKYTMFGVDVFNTFWVMGYIKFLHDDNDNDNDLEITIAQLLFFETDKLKMTS